MARKLRVEYEGAIYHVTVRGVERRKLFKDDQDRERLLKRLGEAVDTYGVRLYLFCLMPNHLHLLIETPRANLSAFMQGLQTAYAVYFNLRHRRAGHLTQGRFGAEPVQGDAYLLRLSRYLHLNPVFVGGMEAQPVAVRRKYLRAYAWSSYRGYAGLDKPYEFVDEAPVLAMTEAPARKRRAAYRRFVEAGIGETDEEFLELLKDTVWGVGDPAFQDWVRDRHAERAGVARRKEDVSFRRMAPRIGAEAVLSAVAKAFGMKAVALRQRQYASAARAVAALLLGRYAGMNQRDVAAFLGMGTGSAVCRQLQRLRERQAQEPALDARVKGIDSTLEGRQAPMRLAQISIVKG